MEPDDLKLLDAFMALPPSSQIQLLKENESVTPAKIAEAKPVNGLTLEDIELEHYKKTLDLKLKVAHIAIYLALIVAGIVIVFASYEIYKSGDILEFIKTAVGISNEVTKATK